ncbi:MAG: PilZ domain-containing protein [Candidatus Aminicenantes bacterium]|nr:PilZ domain-containing protein [Candidatus Aminicenantes bacterium]
MKKRSEARVKKSLLVDISKNGLEQMGVTVNISRRGMCIATTEVFRRRTRLQILIAAADEIYVVTGKVVWHVKKSGLHGENVPAGLGIRIERASPGYFKYIASARKGSLRESKRRLAH